MRKESRFLDAGLETSRSYHTALEKIDSVNMSLKTQVSLYTKEKSTKNSCSQVD